MRFLYLLFLVLLTGLVGLFAYFNQDTVTVRYWDYTVTTTIPVIAGVIYLFGMVTGWTLLRMVSRSAQSVLESVRRELNHQQA